MTEAAEQGTTRAERELLGFGAFFRFTAEHPALYRIIRQAEFVSPETLQSPLRAADASGYVGRARAGDGGGRDRAGRPRGARVEPDGDRRARRHALDPLERRAARCPRRSSTSWRGSSCARSARKDLDPWIGIAATAAYLPSSWMTRGRDRGGERDPGAGDPGEVRAARQAHRRGRTSTSATCRSRRRRGCSASTTSTRPRSTSSSTTARSGRTIRSGRRRRGSRTGSAARTPTRSSTRTSRAARRSRCGSPATSCSPSPSCGTCSLVAACRESYLLDYANERSRFMFNFGDGAVAGLLTRDAPHELLGLPRAHGRLVLAAGEGAGRRLGRARLRGERRRPAPLPRRRRSRAR